MQTNLTRRRFIQVGAALGGAAVLGARSGIPLASATSSEAVNIKGATVTFATIADFEKNAREAAAEFNKLYGATVQFSVSSGIEIRVKLLAEYVGGSGVIDVINISPWWLGDFGPYLEPLESYFSNPKIAMPGYNLHDFPSGLLSSYSSYKGRLVGIPSHVDLMMLLYRSDLFADPKEKKAFKAKYGVDLAPPKTWAEFNRVAAFFTRPSENLWGLAAMGHHANQPAAEWINRFFGFGGHYFQSKETATTHRGMPTINSTAGYNAMAHLVNAGKNYAPPGYTNWDFPDARQAFWAGQTAMFEAWPGTVLVGAQDPKQSQIVGKVNGVVMPNGHGCGGGWFYGVSASSKNKLAAFKWLEFLTAKQSVLRAYQLDGMMPGRNSVYYDRAVTKTLPPGFAHQYSLAYASAMQPPNTFPEDAALLDKLDGDVSAAMSGLQSPRAAINAAQSQWVTIEKKAHRV